MPVEIAHGVVRLLTDGLWFSDCQALYIDEGFTRYEINLIRPLIGNLLQMAEGNQHLSQWLLDHPRPIEDTLEFTSNFSAGRITPLAEWFDAFGDESIRIGGWSLLWRGKLFTNHPVPRVVEILGTHGDDCKRLAWLDETPIEVHTHDQSKKTGPAFTAVNVPLLWKDLALCPEPDFTHEIERADE